MKALELLDLISESYAVSAYDKMFDNVDEILNAATKIKKRLNSGVEKGIDTVAVSRKLDDALKEIYNAWEELE